MNTRDIQNAIKNLDRKSLGNTDKKIGRFIISVTVVAAVLLVAVFAVVLFDFYGINTSSKGGIDLIEPNYDGAG